MVQHYIWAEVSRLDSSVVNLILDELMRTAVDGGLGSQRSEMIADTVGTLSSINVRSRILSRLRKVSIVMVRDLN
jgi:neurofibromin 1